MIVESFFVGALAPAIVVLLLCLFVKSPWMQGLFFIGGLIWGLYYIRGGIGGFQKGGVEASVWLPLILCLPLIAFKLGRLRSFLSVLALGVGVYVISFPVFDSPFSSRIPLAYLLLALSLWSFSKRRLSGNLHLTQLTVVFIFCASVAVMFLLSGSASMSQTFGMFATFAGVSLATSLMYRDRLPMEFMALALVGLPVLFLLMGSVYMNLSPLYLMSYCLPFGVAAVRSFLGPPLRPQALEVLLVGLLSVLTVAWQLYTLMRGL